MLFYVEHYQLVAELMEINIGQKNGGIQSRGGKIPEGGTVISANLKKESKYIDKDGNEIDIVTKKIIRRKDAEPTP